MIELDVLKDAIGEQAFAMSSDYIEKYVSLFPKLEDIADIKIIKNMDKSYSVYDGKGNIINLIKKKGSKYGVFPIGLVCVLSSAILFSTEMSEEYDTVYEQFEYVYAMPYNERMDQFLYYFNIIIVDVFGLDIHRTNAELSENNYVLIDGRKEEWVLVDKDIRGEIDVDDVIYIIESWADRDKINVKKSYGIESMKDDRYKLSIYDIINQAFDEFETKRIARS